MSDEKLKPCPFCGGEGVLQEHLFHGYSSTYGVVCFDCCAETKQFFTNKKTAIRAWNKRKAENKRKPTGARGKWIIRDNPDTRWYRITCSHCGEDVTSVVPTVGFMPNVKVLWDFCPECGADMRQGSEVKA